MFQKDRLMYAPLLCCVCACAFALPHQPAAAIDDPPSQESVATSLASAIETALQRTNELEIPAPSPEPSEVDTLKLRVTELEQRIARLEARILELTERLEQVLTPIEESPTEGESELPDPAPATQEPEAPVEPPAATPQVPADPLASPEAVVDSMRVAFKREMMSDPSFVLGLDSPDPRAQKEADRVLQSWVRQTEARYRRRITWPVRLSEGRELPGGDWEYSLQVIDQAGEAEGEPFTQVLGKQLAQRVRKWEDRKQLSRLLLKGMLEPRLRIIPHEDPSSQFNPAILVDSKQVLVSRWVGFEFDVRLTTIIPVIEDAAPEPPPAGGQPDPAQPQEGFDNASGG